MLREIEDEDDELDERELEDVLIVTLIDEDDELEDEEVD